MYLIEVSEKEEFLDLPPSLLEEICQRDSLCVRESDLFQAVAKWGAKKDMVHLLDFSLNFFCFTFRLIIPLPL